jgi:hypothetical protein
VYSQNLRSPSIRRRSSTVMKEQTHGRRWAINIAKGRALEIDPLGILLEQPDRQHLRGFRSGSLLNLEDSTNPAPAKSTSDQRPSRVRKFGCWRLSQFAACRVLWRNSNPDPFSASKTSSGRDNPLTPSSLTDLLEVDVRGPAAPSNLFFRFRGTPLTFVANVGTAALVVRMPWHRFGVRLSLGSRDRR